jgi:hypothetical protein
MSVREIRIFEGLISQPLANSIVYADMPIHVGNQRAIQVYQAEFSIAPDLISFEPAKFSIAVGLYVLDKHNLVKHTLHRWRVACVIGGSPTVVELTDSWVAPPSLIFAEQTLRVELVTSGMSSEQDLNYQIYYKSVVVTDTQVLLLNLT